jgi:outer membrane protein OmpA-like peptidoglycan-associated protein
VLDAAAGLAKAYQGEVCIHTVQAGNDAAGAKFLRRLSETTDCGSARTASSVTNVASLQGMERDVYLGAALPDVAAAPRVWSTRTAMACWMARTSARTPRLASRSTRAGCWVLNVHFAFDSTVIEPKYYDELNRVAARLKEVGPDTIVRVDGHTDSIGAEAYNENLSERRAQAVARLSGAAGSARYPAPGKGIRREAAGLPRTTAGTVAALNRRTELSRL